MPSTPSIEMPIGRTAWGADVPCLVQTDTGAEGCRDFKVGTGDMDQALLLQSGGGLPKINDPWSAQYPKLIAKRITTKRIGGIDDAATQVGAWTWVRVEYQTPRFGTLGNGAKEGDKYTLVKPGTTTFLRMYAVDAVPGDAPIAGGSGVTCTRGNLSASVVKYLKQNGNNPIVDFSELTGLQDDQAVNSDAVTLPAVQGTTIPLNFTPGQVQYAGYSIVQEGLLVQLTHELRLARDFLARWREQDVSGNMTGAEQEAVCYVEAAMAALLG